jgi:transposase-like protein
VTAAYTAPHFQGPDAARAMIEAIRWPDGPVCGHCGERGRRYDTKRPGRYRCGNPACRKDYTVTTGTVMESSHIPLNKWLLGFYLLNASKKGFSAHQLHRSLGVTYKTAWFMAHRIREAMRSGGLVTPMGGAGKVVEADETYFGKVEEERARKKYLPPPTKGRRTGPAGKRAIVSLMERGGSVRSFQVAIANGGTMGKIVTDNIARESRLYTKPGAEFAAHETVAHAAKEYAREDVHTNTVEGYFAIFKRGMRGIYQHCREKHLYRYLAEFDFRYNHRVKLGFTDMERTLAAVKGAEGKRLTYRESD